MIIVGETVLSTKVKVNGAFVDGSHIETIAADSPPNPPENQIGKDAVLYLNPATGNLFWDYVDRPLTDSEKISQSEEQRAAMLLALVMGGLM